MKRFIPFAIVLAASASGMAENSWEGVDDKVIGKFAAAAGRKVADPGFWGKGDVPLFAFFLAGAAGGFLFGYYFRQLFPSRQKDKKNV